MKVKVTEEGLLIPKEVAERAFASSDEVEVFEEPGRLLIVGESQVPSPGDAGVRSGPGAGPDEDPILTLGRKPVHTGVRDGSTNHDRHLYDAGG